MITYRAFKKNTTEIKYLIGVAAEIIVGLAILLVGFSLTFSHFIGR